MNCLPSKPLTTALDYMLFLAPETFFPSVLGKGFEKRQPCEDIKTLYSMMRVCQALKTKIDSCWNVFIRQSEYISRFFDPLKTDELVMALPDSPNREIIAKKVAKNALVERYRTLKKWARVDLEEWKTVNLEKWKAAKPDVIQDELPANINQTILPDHFGNPTLCLESANNKSFVHINLETKESNEKFININYPCGRMNPNCNPCMVTNGNWTALAALDRELNQIVIFDNDKNILHTIVPKADIFQLQCHEDDLYALQKEYPNTYKLVRYNSNNWKEAPSEFFFPKDIMAVYKFCLCSEKMVFFALGQDGKHYLLAVAASELFSGNIAILRRGCSDLKLKLFGEEIFTLASVGQRVSLNRLCINDRTIESKTLQTFQINIQTIHDFHVQLDKIFILIKRPSHECSISYYDLISGDFLQEFAPNNKIFDSTNFPPQFFVSTAEKIQLLYHTLRENRSNDDPPFSLVTTSFSLNYTKKE